MDITKGVYEKPKMTFVSLQNRENVAEKCWGNHSTGYKYYDTVGSGYVAFTLANNSCSAEDKLLMYFYEDKNDKEPEEIFRGDPRYDEIYGKVTVGGNYGSSFKGEEQFPDTPAGMS